MNKSTLIALWSGVAIFAISAVIFLWLYNQSVNARRALQEVAKKDAEVADLAIQANAELKANHLESAKRLANMALQIDGASNHEVAEIILRDVEQTERGLEKEKREQEKQKSAELALRKKREQAEAERRQRELREQTERETKLREQKARQEQERLRIAKERENNRYKMLERFIGTWDFSETIIVEPVDPLGSNFRGTTIGTMLIKWGPKKHSLEIRYLESRLVGKSSHLRPNEVITPTLLPNWTQIYTAMPDLYYWGKKDSDFYRPMGVWDPKLEEFNYKGFLNNGSKITTTLYFSDNGNRFDLISHGNKTHITFTAKRK